MRAFWTSAIFLLLGFTACTSKMDVTQDSFENANQKLVSTASKTGLSLIEVPNSTSARELALELRLHGIRPLVVTSDSKIIIEALNIDPAILPAGARVSALPSPYPELPSDPDGGEEPLVGESSQAVAGPLVTDAVEPSDEALEKSGQGNSNCRYPPHCFPSLSGTVGIQVFFPESKEGVPGEHEDWQPGEIEKAMETFHFELASLARVAPPDIRLMFYVVNLGALEVNGEPTSGYNPDIVLNELMPRIRALNHLPEPSLEDNDIYGLYRTMVSPLIDRDSLTTVTLVGVARDMAAPFATNKNPSDPSAPSYWNWWPTAYLGAPYARSRWGGQNEQNDGRTFVHEVLHTFGALDQYSTSDGRRNDCRYLADGEILFKPLYDRMAGSGAPRSSGKIISNGNATDCTDSQVAIWKLPDIMKNSTSHFSSWPFARPMLSWFTRAQIGWGSSRAVWVKHSGFSRWTRELQPSPEVKINGLRHLSLPLAYGEFNIGETFVYVASSETRLSFQSEINGIVDGTSTTYQRIDCQKDTVDVIGDPADNNGEFGNDGRVLHIQRTYQPKVPDQAVACPLEPSRIGKKE